MSDDLTRQVYESLGARPIINAGGNKTILGGSRVSPAVQAAAEAANRYYVEMEELLKQSGQALADILQAEAALVTPGCFSAMALSAAAIMTGSDPDRIKQLPDTSGMKNEFIIQKCQRYKYERALSIGGGKIIEAGDENDTTVAQLEAAITSQTAALHCLAVGKQAEVGLPIETMVEVAKAHDLAVIVDAASAIYPMELLTRYTTMGADAVCFGAKYLGAYNGTGILAGKKHLVEAAYQHGFVDFEVSESGGIGRGFKLDRQEVVAVVAALHQWIEMDHEERFADHEQRGQVILQAVAGQANIEAQWIPEDRGLDSSVKVVLDEAGLGKSAAELAQALKAGSPSIWATSYDNIVQFNVTTLYEGEAETIAERLGEALAGT